MFSFYFCNVVQRLNWFNLLSIFSIISFHLHQDAITTLGRIVHLFKAFIFSYILQSLASEPIAYKMPNFLISNKL